MTMSYYCVFSQEAEDCKGNSIACDIEGNCHTITSISPDGKIRDRGAKIAEIGEVYFILKMRDGKKQEDVVVPFKSIEEREDYKRLPAATRDIIKMAYEGVVKTHEAIKGLKLNDLERSAAYREAYPPKVWRPVEGGIQYTGEELAKS